MEEKYNTNQAAYQIKKLAASKAVLSNSGSDTSAQVPRKNKSRTGALPDRNNQSK